MNVLLTSCGLETEIIEKKFMDILNPQPEDNRTAEEIVADVFEKMGIEVK